MSVIKDITNSILNDKPLLEWSHSENNYYKRLEENVAGRIPDFASSMKPLRSYIYTRLKKRCQVKSINDGQCDTMELWEDDKGKCVTGFHFLIFKIFSFQDNLKSELRHAVLL